MIIKSTNNKMSEKLSKITKSDYPKIMLVWDRNENDAEETLVLFYEYGFYWVAEFEKSIEEINASTSLMSYKYAKDIESQITEQELKKIDNRSLYERVETRLQLNLCVSKEDIIELLEENHKLKEQIK